MTGDRSASAGRDMKGNAIATGDHSTATSTYSETVQRDPSVDLKAELAALRQALESLPGVDKKALTRLEEAEEEATKPEPNPGEIQSLVKQATGYAQTATGFMDAAGKLVPHLTKVAAWLGVAWTALAPMLSP
jgi:hypothetical protein